MARVDVFVCRLNRPAAFLDAMSALLNREEQERADRFRFPQHRHAFIAARGQLRTILGRRLGIAAADIRFAYAEHGKPSILGNSPVHFNLSHSGDLALVALCDDVAIGIDVERIHAIEDLEAIARRFFHPTELQEILALDEELRPRAFFNCWTRKEAFIKAVGSGLSYPLHRFQVSLQPGAPPQFVHIEDRPTDAWSLHDLPVEEGYVAALAVPHRECQIAVDPFEL